MKTLVAIEALAKHFSASWEKGEGPPDAYLVVAKKRIAIEIASAGSARIANARPRLRFDKVALGFVEHLRSALGETVPPGKTLVLTVTAPIRQDLKTVREFEDSIRKANARPVRATILRNRVRARFVKGGGTARVIGFVHNPDVDGTVLLDATQSFLAAMGKAVSKHRRLKSRGTRWLVLAGGDGFAEVYRQICVAGATAAGFGKIVQVRNDGRVEDIAAWSYRSPTASHL